MAVLPVERKERHPAYSRQVDLQLFCLFGPLVESSSTKAVQSNCLSGVGKEESEAKCSQSVQAVPYSY